MIRFNPILLLFFLPFVLQMDVFGSEEEYRAGLAVHHVLLLAATAAMCAYAFAAWHAGHIRLLNRGFGWLIAIAVYNFLTVACSSNPSYTLYSATSFVGFALLSILIFQDAGPDEWRATAIRICLIFVGLSLVNFYAADTQRDNFAPVIAAVGLYYCWVGGRRHALAAMFFAAALAFFLSAATLGCAAFAFAMVAVYRRLQHFPGAALAIVAGAMALAGYVIANLAFFQVEVLRPVFAAIGKDPDAAISFSGRFAFWTDVTPLLRNNWTGYGFGSAEKYYMWDYMVRHRNWLLGEPLKHTHNMYLSILIQQGYIGLGLWTGLFASLIAGIGRMTHEMRAPVLFLVLLFLSNGVSIEVIAGEFSMACALLIGCMCVERRAQRPHNEFQYTDSVAIP